MRTAQRLSLNVRPVTDHDGKTTAFMGLAYDRDSGDPVGTAEVSRGGEYVERYQDYDRATGRVFFETNWDEDPAPGQIPLPIKSDPSKVSWALANKKGRTLAAPHALVAAITQRWGVKPVADAELSQGGSGMAKSALKRGLLGAHPSNPTARANTGIPQTERWANAELDAAATTHRYDLGDRPSTRQWYELDRGETQRAVDTILPRRKKSAPAPVYQQQQFKFD